jgi:multisubunit Na+/H+ antiporter MnhE subunit
MPVLLIILLVSLIYSIIAIYIYVSANEVAPMVLEVKTNADSDYPFGILKLFFV